MLAPRPPVPRAAPPPVGGAACPKCHKGAAWSIVSPGALRTGELPCDECGSIVAVPGTDVYDRLDQSSLTPRDADSTALSLGLRAGDVMSIRGRNSEVFLEC